MYSIILPWIIGPVSLLASIIYAGVNQDFTYLYITLVYYYLVSFFGNTICYHRYLSHRTFETGLVRKTLLLIANLLSGQGSIFYAVSLHRHHHKHSDKERDVHSSKEGYISSFFFSIRSPKYFQQIKKVRPAIDLMKDSQVMFFHKKYLHCWMLLTVVLFFISWKILCFVVFASIGLITLHTNIVRTFISHNRILGSYRNFETDDNSYNFKSQFIALGEALHNNHHACPNAVNQATTNKEFDPAGYFIVKYLLK